MTDKELSRLAAHLPFMRAWIDAIEAEIFKRLEAGAEIPPCELVPKRAQRKWKEGVDIIALLSPFGDLDRIAPRVPLSPSKAEEAFGKAKLKGLAEHVVKESSGMNLAYRPR